VKVALYMGSFDPMTLGHYDVIKRASNLFDKLIVGIGEARGKTSLFTVEERLAMIKEMTRELANVETHAFMGLAINYAAKIGAIAMVRGVRSSADYSYEMQMALMNRAMNPGIETIFFPTSPQYSHISSSLAKEIALHGGDMNLLVPPLVSKRLAERVKGTNP
jgi:pantetheine-phosphate adenylyltransferase